MTKGFYDLNKPPPPVLVTPRNSQWKSFTCSVLIFTTICLIILLVSWKSKETNYSDKPRNGSADAIYDKQIASENINNKTSSKLQNDPSLNKKMYGTYNTKQNNSEVDDLNNPHSTITPNPIGGTQNTTNKNLHSATAKYFNNDKSHQVISHDKISTENVTTTTEIMIGGLRTTTYKPTLFVTTTEKHTDNFDSTEKPSFATTTPHLNHYATTQHIEQKEITEEDTTNHESNPLTKKNDGTTTTQIYSDTNEDSININNTLFRTDVIHSVAYIKPEECDSKICQKAASKMLGLLNIDINPCEDFHSFACDGLFRDTNLNDLSTDVLGRITDKLGDKKKNPKPYEKVYKDFMMSCIDYDPFTDGYSRVQAKMEEVSKKYIHSQNFPSISYLLPDLLQNGFAPILDIKVQLHENTKKNGIDIYPGNIDTLLVNIGNKNYYEKICFEQLQKKEKGFILSYRDYVSCTEDYLKVTEMVDKILKSIDVFKNYDQLPKIIKFLYEDKPKNAEIRKTIQMKYYTVKTVKYLKEKISLITWDNVFQTLLGETLDDSVEVHVYFLEYLEKLLEILAGLEKKQLYKAMTALYVHSIYKDFILNQNVYDRHSYCLKAASVFMPDITSELYLSSFSSEETEKLCEYYQNIFESLKHTIKNEISAGRWLSDESNKVTALQKINNLKLYINSEKVKIEDNCYLTTNVSSDDFINNSGELEKHLRDQLYGSYGNFVDNISNINIRPYDSKVSLVSPLDYIVLPLSTVIHSIFAAEMPMYLPLGDIGFQLAKQINLHLLNCGIEILQQKIQPNIRQGVTLVKKGFWQGDIPIEMDYVSSAMERISDNGGAKLVLVSFNNIKNVSTNYPLISLNKSNDEILFVQMAQSFCKKPSPFNDQIELLDRVDLPSLIRVNSIASNSEEFIEIFNCPDNKMNGAILLNPINDHPTEEYDDGSDILGES